MLTSEQVVWASTFLGINLESGLAPADTAVKAPPSGATLPGSSHPETPSPNGREASYDAVGGDDESVVRYDEKAAAPGGGKGGAGGEKSAGEGKTEVIIAALKWLVSKADDATLKAQVGSAMPKGKTEDDFQWKGPVKTYAIYPKEKSLLHITTIAYAQVEIGFYYSGKYINNFHAHLTDASVDKTASLSAELTIDDKNVGNSADGIAHLDWTLTFRREHFTGSKLVTVTGRASGNGTYTTSQPGFDDIIQESEQEEAAKEAAKTPNKP